MHIDGMIATVLRQVPADEKSRIGAWRQLTDILAQRGDQLAEQDARKALHALAYLRPHVPESVRRHSALSVAARCRFAPLVAFFAADAQPIARAFLLEAPLSGSDWLAYLPSSSPAARAILRERRDLPADVVRALDAFGTNRMRIAADAEAALHDETDMGSIVSLPLSESAAPRVSQITELVQRIDDYRSQKRAEAAAKTETVPLESFLFEVGSDGLIFWVTGAPRGALIGLDIATAASASEPGVDGNAAGAFRQRGEIRNARLLLQGGPDVSGEWRISGVPWFDRATGQFRGYRGHARRPHPHEIAHVEAGDSAGDSIRQLIHELRSPLNAISGFAQIVESQMFGPVSQGYRAMASTIVQDAANLQQIIEDLDAAARADQPPSPANSGDSADLMTTLSLVVRDVYNLMQERGASLMLPADAAAGARVALSEAQCRRLIGRLMTAFVDVAAPGETLPVMVDASNDPFTVEIARPRAIEGCSEAELLDPGFSPAGDPPAASILSLGFSLRLVGSLARQNGGQFRIGETHVSLQLPAALAPAAGSSDRITGD